MKEIKVPAKLFYFFVVHTNLSISVKFYPRSKHCFLLANFLVTIHIHRVLSGKQLGYRLQKDGPPLSSVSRGFPSASVPSSINSGWRNKFYIRLCALLLFQARALGTVDISDGRVLVTKCSVDLSQSFVRDVGGPVFLSPRRDADRLSPSRSPPSLSACLFLILRFVLLLSSSSLSLLLRPPPLLTASLGAASTSSLRQEYKDLDDPGCSGRPSGVTTTFKALAALLFYDAVFLVPKILPHAVSYLGSH